MEKNWIVTLAIAVVAGGAHCSSSSGGDNCTTSSCGTNGLSYKTCGAATSDAGGATESGSFQYGGSTCSWTGGDVERAESCINAVESWCDVQMIGMGGGGGSGGGGGGGSSSGSSSGGGSDAGPVACT